MELEKLHFYMNGLISFSFNCAFSVLELENILFIVSFKTRTFKNPTFVCQQCLLITVESGN